MITYQGRELLEAALIAPVEEVLVEDAILSLQAEHELLVCVGSQVLYLLG